MKDKVLIVLIICFCFLATVNTEVILLGGATMPQMMYYKLHFAFSILNDDSNEVFLSSSGSGEGKNDILDSTGKYQIISTEIPFTDEELEEHDSIVSFPSFGSSVVPIFNVPGIDESIAMTPDVLAKILNGNITRWNDPEILENCPELDGVDEIITISASPYVSGTTYTYTSALSMLVPWWNSSVGVFDIWSEEQKEKVSFHEGVGGVTGIAIVVEYTPYTLGFVPISSSITGSLKFIDLVIDDEIVTAFDLLNVSIDVDLDEHLRGVSVGAYKWPFVALSYSAFDSTLFTSCEEMSMFLLYFNWALESEEFITSSGYMALSTANQNKIREYFFAQECDGKPVISYQFLQKPGAAPMVILILMLVLALALLFVFIYIGTRVHLKIEQLINTSFGIGSELLLLSIIFWYLEPSIGFICEMRIILTTVGLVVLNGITVSKSWQLIKISKMNANSKMNNNKIFFISMITSITIQIAFLVVWLTADPYMPYIQEVDSLNLQYEYMCSSENISLWISLQFANIGLLTIWGFFTTYKTWKLTNLYDPRFNLFNLYFTGVMVLAIAFLITTIESEEQTYLVMSVSIFLLTTGTLLPHFIQTVRTITKSGSKEKHKSKSKKIEYAKRARNTK